MRGELLVYWSASQTLHCALALPADTADRQEAITLALDELDVIQIQTEWPALKSQVQTVIATYGEGRVAHVQTG